MSGSSTATRASKSPSRAAARKASTTCCCTAASASGSCQHRGCGGTRVGFSATTELNRQDFGIDFNIPMDGGGVVIGHRIQVFIEIEAVLHPPMPAGTERLPRNDPRSARQR
jgi:hypothetical protein